MGHKADWYRNQELTPSQIGTSTSKWLDAYIFSYSSPDTWKTPVHGC